MPIVMKSGSLNLLEPSGPVFKPVMGLLLPYFNVRIGTYRCLVRWVSSQKGGEECIPNVSRKSHINVCLEYQNGNGI
jgi:hypothetical protein